MTTINIYFTSKGQVDTREKVVQVRVKEPLIWAFHNAHPTQTVTWKIKFSSDSPFSWKQKNYSDGRPGSTVYGTEIPEDAGNFKYSVVATSGLIDEEEDPWLTVLGG